MPKIRDVRMTFCMPGPMKNRLQKYSQTTGLSEAEILRRTISEFFDRLDWRDRVETYYEPKSLAEVAAGFTAGPATVLIDNISANNKEKP